MRRRRLRSIRRKTSSQYRTARSEIKDTQPSLGMPEPRPCWTSINSFVMAYYRKLLIWFSPHYLAFATRRGHNVSITLFRCLRLLHSVRMAPSSIFYPCARYGRSRIKNTPGWFRPSPTPLFPVSLLVSVRYGSWCSVVHANASCSKAHGPD